MTAVAGSGCVASRVLDRLERRVGGVRAGSSSFIYTLGPVGQRLVPGERARPRRYEPGALFVHHQLAVSQLVVDLTLAARRGELELLTVEAEPDCWRTVPAIGRVVLRPDLFLVIGSGELEYRWFVEVDRGTHHRPALLRKARLYEGYYRSGVEQATHGVFPRVLWVTPTTARANALRDAISGSGFTEGLIGAVMAEQAISVLAGGAP